jgi:hypothetical protein
LSFADAKRIIPTFGFKAKPDYHAKCRKPEKENRDGTEE